MIFNSIIFMFIFLPLVLLAYYMIPVNKIQNIVLFAASLIFYFCGAGNYIVIILLSIFVNYLAGLAIAYIGRLKIILVADVIFNLGLLVYFKYADFLLEQYSVITKNHVQFLNTVLPIGISFFTFQGLSYVFDLYRGKIEVQKNPVYIGLYITMFPQLIAGPIVRYADISYRITNRAHSLDKIADGICRFTIGLAKKAILADSVGSVADQVFQTSYTEHAVFTCWLGIICYTFQILFDFMGYSDMAIGIGKMFGFDFPENFDLPYTSKSIQEFWRRWHMTLGAFFRDYVYIPLGGGKKKVYRNLWIVFFLTGLWHGASWNFIIWGLWHGSFLMLERMINSKGDWLKNANPVLRNIVTLAVVMIGWIIFRAEDMQYAIGFIGRMIGIPNTTSVYLKPEFYMDRYLLFILIICLLQSFGVGKIVADQWKQLKYNRILKHILITILLLIDVMFVMNSTYSPFLYFQF